MLPDKGNFNIAFDVPIPHISISLDFRKHWKIYSWKIAQNAREDSVICTRYK